MPTTIHIYSPTTSDLYIVTFKGATILSIVQEDEDDVRSETDFNRLPSSVQNQILKRMSKCQNQN